MPAQPTESLSRPGVEASGGAGKTERRRAALLAIGLYGGFMALHLLLAWDGGRVVKAVLPHVDVWLGPVGWAIYAVFAVGAAIAVKANTGVGRRPTTGWIRLSLPLLAAGSPFLLFGYNLDARSVVPLLVVGVPLISLNEELFFRGVLLDLLKPFAWRRAVLWSSVAFGASHVVNLVAGAYPPFIAMQVAATTAGGVALAAIRIRTGSLWPALFVHLVIDLIAVSTLTGAATTSPILLPVLFIWLGANLAMWPYGWRLLGRSSSSKVHGKRRAAILRSVLRWSPRRTTIA
jgi:membrane protease YdiL (CAAX protease family)